MHIIQFGLPGFWVGVRAGSAAVSPAGASLEIFNYDFQVTIDPSVTRPVHNYEPVEVTESTEVGGHSCFLTDGERIFYTYSAYARGSEPTIGAYALLDLTALGRHEDWEEPKGRVPKPHPADPTFTS